jgi:hypothetical protein
MARSIAAALIAAAALGFTAGAQQAERFTLGVMRRDGVVIPFAAFAGDWSLPWPGSIRDIELPITLEAVPAKWWGGELRQPWTLWSPGGTATPVTPRSPALVMVGEERRLGVRTSFQSAELPALPLTVPYPKEGVVVAGDVKIERIASVSRLSPAWKELAQSIRRDIDSAEQKAIDRIKNGPGWIHPIPRFEREQIPSEIEAWYTSGLEQPGFAISYIEAVKKYPPGVEDEGCGLETFVSGWVHKNNRLTELKTDLSAHITYCDRKGISYMLPFGRLRAKSRTHWVFQLSSWEREWYAVAEVTPGRLRVVAEYLGGARTPF